MSADSDPLESLAASVSDGSRVDWAQASSTEAAPDAAVAALREVSRIADFNRQLQRGPDDSAGNGDPGQPAEPRRWGDLLMLEPLGSGASGEVWRAWDLRLEREVALKFLQPRDDAPTASPDATLAAEARALARVRHPGVVTVHGIDVHEGRVGMWMELLRGETLAATIERRGALPPREVEKIGREVAQALDAVHHAGLIHRDVKPANVVLEASGRVVLTDFGLGRRAHDAPQVWRLSGTPVFMAPELLGGGMATPRSDLYALGVSLRWALTGRCPFAARTIEDLRAEAIAGPRRSIAAERADAPAPLAGVIERAMAPDPEARFGGAAELARALAATGDTVAPTPARRHAPGARSRWILAAAALPALAAALWIAGSRQRPTQQPPPVVEAPSATAAAAYDVEAALERRSGETRQALAQGDRVKPGDRLSLRFRATRDAWVYVINEDERGECYLLFPQPLFDQRNPIPPGSEVTLPGTIRGQENAWTVTSRGGREHFLVVASPHPLPAIEAELQKLPAAIPGRPIQYAAVSAPTLERLRGVGGVSAVPAPPSAESRHLVERFAGLAGRETDVRGVWVRKVTLENPLR